MNKHPLGVAQKRLRDRIGLINRTKELKKLVDHCDAETVAAFEPLVKFIGTDDYKNNEANTGTPLPLTTKQRQLKKRLSGPLWREHVSSGYGNSRMLEGGTILDYWMRCWNFGK